MNRRRLLATTPLFALGSAGCLDRVRGPDPDLPDGMSVETVHQTRGTVLERNDPFGAIPSDETPDSFQTSISDAAAAVDRLTRDDEIDALVRETAFEESYLLVVATGYWQSSYELVVTAITRTGAGLDVAIDAESPFIGPGEDDSTLHVLVLRVTDEQAGLPDVVNVAVDNEETRTTEFERRLGAADPIEVETSVDRPIEYDEDADRVSVETELGEREYAVEEWTTRCATTAAADRLRSELEAAGIVETILSEDEEKIDVALGVERGFVPDEQLEAADVDPSTIERAVELGPIVRHTTVYDEDGERAYGVDGNLAGGRGPQVPFDEAVEATPRSIDVTVAFDERTNEVQLPVLCLAEEVRHN
ncbi:hypothetical protein ACLI4Z_13565 [Natrialbaceae archaeon A-arb3/5]